MPLTITYTMYFLTFTSLFICTALADYRLSEICAFPNCVWQGEGLYFSDKVVNGVDTLNFNRIQNSLISLKKPP